MLNQDFKEFIEALNSKQVRYLVIGGYAVALHGYPRYTKDLDVWVEMSADNAQRVVEALEAFGFGTLGLEAADFLEAGQIIQLGYPPARIDIITRPSGVKFEESYQTRVEVELGGVRVKFIGLEELKKSKRAAGRMQDMADLENLG
jgi:predicted nucleotidyltransferase